MKKFAVGIETDVTSRGMRIFENSQYFFKFTPTKNVVRDHKRTKRFRLKQENQNNIYSSTTGTTSTSTTRVLLI